MGKPFSPGRPDADKICFVVQRPRCHRSLGLYLVTGVNESRIAAIGLKIKRNKFRPVFRIDKFLDAVNPACRIDMRNAFSYGLHLGLSQCGIKCMNLSIDVGLRNMIQVNQCQTGHTAPCQRLGGPGTDAAQAHYDDMCCPDTRRTGDPVQTCKPSKAAIKVYRS